MKQNVLRYPLHPVLIHCISADKNRIPFNLADAQASAYGVLESGAILIQKPSAPRSEQRLGLRLLRSDGSMRRRYQSIGIRFPCCAMRSRAARLVSTFSLVVPHAMTMLFKHW